MDNYATLFLERLNRNIKEITRNNRIELVLSPKVKNELDFCIVDNLYCSPADYDFFFDYLGNENRENGKRIFLEIISESILEANIIESYETQPR